MPKEFKPPFRIEVDFYDSKGDLLEWCDHWGDCPEAAEVRYVVTDIKERTVSTHNTREKAEAAMSRMNTQTNAKP